MLCFLRIGFCFAQLASFWALILRNDLEFPMFSKFTYDSSRVWPKRMGFGVFDLSLEA